MKFEGQATWDATLHAEDATLSMIRLRAFSASQVKFLMEYIALTLVIQAPQIWGFLVSANSV